MSELCAVVLAAGEGKRMKSGKPKVMLEVLLKPMLGWVLDAARGAGVGDVCVVTGHLEEQVKAYLGSDAVTVTQHERKGTGHAVMMAKDFLEAHRGGRVLIACGDAPFLDTATITNALEQHIARGDAVTVISAELDDPFGYGRIIRTADGAVQAIVEQKEGTDEQLAVREVNSGAYWFDVDALLQVLDPGHLAASGITGEHYLTDAVAAVISIGRGAGAYTAATPDVVLGANNPVQLHELGEMARTRIISRHIASGIAIPCADGVLIGSDVEIGHDTVILPGTILKGSCTIGANCVIGPNAFIDSCTVGDGVTVNASYLCGVSVGDNETVGPFASLR
ncbi:MAG: cytidylyltransferase [Ruminococcaceae bacterium]|nr:cytidylyltransferase [Oscillospiraceae bacterium]